MRKPAFCICLNKGVDQLSSNRAADQRLCFRYIASTIPLLCKSKIKASNHLLWLYSPASVRPAFGNLKERFSSEESQLRN